MRWKICKTILSVFVLTLLSCNESGVWHRSMTLGTTANTQRRFDEAERFFLVALEETEKFESGDKRTLETCSTLAEFYHRRDRFEDAKPFYEKALVLKQMQLGEADPEVIKDRNNLVQLCYVLNDYPQAESLGTRAMELTESALGKDSPELADLLRVMGELYQEQSRFEEAEPLFLRELKIEESDTNRFNIPMTLNNLAVFYHEWHKYAVAESLYYRSLEMNEKKLGEKSYELLTIILNLAGLYSETEDYFRAEQLYRRALELHSEHRPRSYFKRVAILNKLANVCLHQAKYFEARNNYRNALRLIDRGTGMHPDVLEIITNYVPLLLMTGDDDEAARLMERAQKIRQTLGINEEEKEKTGTNPADIAH